MHTEYTNIRKKINLVYYCLYVLYVVLVAVFGFLYKPAEHNLVLDPLSQTGQIVSYIVIFYILISVPGALWLFKKKMKSVSEMENLILREKTYLRYALLRVSVIGVGALLAIPAFYLLGGYKTMLWCAGIAIIAQYFCKPTDRKIYLEMNNKTEDDL